MDSSSWVYLQAQCNYAVLQETWGKVIEATKDMETKMRIQEVRAHANVCLFLAACLVRLSSNTLTISVKHSNMHACLQPRSASCFNDNGHSKEFAKWEAVWSFWDLIILQADELENKQPQLQWKRNLPHTYRFDDGKSIGDFQQLIGVLQLYNFIYFEAIDLIANCIHNEFDQPE